MLIRYKTTKNGKRKKLAHIYTADDHGIRHDSLDREAVTVVNRLNRAGFKAYIVGGAVRDLLIGKKPKDFDVVTNAPPRKIRGIFRNSRIIGRRFQLVHVYYGEKIIEVSTFRTASPETEDNIFGTMSEDVLRRDFTMNALFYDPENEQIIDYIGGYDDVRARRVSALIPVSALFPEDPVRMIRALRYAATTGFRLEGRISRHIRKSAYLIHECSVSRLTEEMFKILSSGNSKDVIDFAYNHALLKYLLPEIDRRLRMKGEVDYREKLGKSLEELDGITAGSQPIHKGVMIASLVQPFIEVQTDDVPDIQLARREIFLQVKALIAPLTPPNVEVEKAAQRILGITHRKPYGKRRRRRRHPAPHDNLAGIKRNRA